MSLKLFWSAAALILYTYLLYPALVFVRALFLRRPYERREITPRVSLIVAAYNESKNIAAKIENILALNYPAEELEILIASDGSTDGTNEIVAQYAARYADRGIQLLALPRQGKAGALNSAVAVATGEILVFSDANSIYAPDSIQALVRHFASPEVGGVAGNQVYLKDKERASLSSAGEHSYWDFDRKLKQMQSVSGNVISATGAIYAIRRALFNPVVAGVTDDFAISTDIIRQGYRLVFEPDAIAYEPVASGGSTEFGRKVRVITRGLRAVILRRELLNPFHYGFYALQLFSHKVLRRLVVFPLLILLVSSPFLWKHGLFYRLATVGQTLFYGSAALGMSLHNSRLKRLKIVTLPFYFCLVNYAALLAVINILRGHRIERWEPQRQPDLHSATQERLQRS
jgi:cellulose synthase/poly-beta-1,6-N-acetylglucosamine synthase-like glycosyltransferase